jgi:predicted MFS family arabinose efflux permease
MVGSAMTNTALYWLTIHVARGSAIQLAVLTAVQFLPILVLSRRAGMVVTRHRSGPVLALTLAAQTAGALAIGVPLLTGWMTIWYLCLLACAIGCAQTVGLPAGQMFMLELVGRAELRRGSSLYSMVMGLAKIAGPGLAGFVIATAGTGQVFIADAVSFLLAIAVLVRLSRTVGPAADSGETPAAAPRRFRWILDLPRGVQLAAAMALLVGGFGYQFEVTNPLMATKVFHLSPEGFGVLGTMMAVGGIAGSYVSSRRADPSRAEFLLWALIFGTAECVAAVMPAPWEYDAVAVVIGGATTLFAISTTVYMRLAAPPAQLGQALSAYNAAFMGFVPAGAFAVAAVAGLAGTRWALIGPGLVIVACAAGAQVRVALAGRAAVAS